MFDLTSKKTWFFLVSLIVIIPGIFAIAAWGLNPGIDFTGGTTVDLRFQSTLPNSLSGPIGQTFTTQANAKDVKVYFSQQINSNSAQIFWVQLNVPIDSTVRAEITKRLTDQSSLLGTVQELPYLAQATTDGGKTHFTLLAYQITPPSKTGGGAAFTVTAAQVQSIITAKALPDTTPVAIDTSASTPTPVPTVVATGTPTKSTAGASTGTSTTAPPTTQHVTLTKVYAGTSNQIITIQTQTLLTPAELANVESTLLAQHGVLYQSQVQSVGPSIAGSTTFLAFMAVIAASVAILLYVGYAFRNVGSFGKALRYGICAIVALLHDVLVVMGVWAILGHIFPAEFKVDTLFVTAILTVIGFSVHDTIVVFDRIRENSQRRSLESFTDIVNASLLQTMARSLNTSLTVLVTLSALTIFGGASIRPFTLALLVGIFSGTYSSIFNASMLLVVWETGDWRSLFPWMQPRAIVVRNGRTGVATR